VQEIRRVHKEFGSQVHHRQKNDPESKRKQHRRDLPLTLNERKTSLISVISL
jgi:hypothetical protein